MIRFILILGIGIERFGCKLTTIGNAMILWTARRESAN